jgi:hypothetical protein
VRNMSRQTCDSDEHGRRKVGLPARPITTRKGLRSQRTSASRDFKRIRAAGSKYLHLQIYTALSSLNHYKVQLDGPEIFRRPEATRDVSLLSFHQFLERLKKGRVGYCCSLGISDKGLALRAKSRNGKGHGNPVIVKGIELGPM